VSTSNTSNIGKWLEVQHNKIRKWASGISHKLNAADLDDVVQTVSLELLKTESAINEPEALARTLTTYRVIDLLRQRAKAPENFECADDPTDITSSSERRIGFLRRPSSGKEQCMDLWKAVGQLPDPHKTILIQRWIEGNTFAYIAIDNKLPESTARHYYGEAVEQLGRILKCVCLSGGVTDDDTKSLSAAAVIARGVKVPDYRRTLTDGHGQFSMVLLQKGQYSLRTRKTGYKDDARYLELNKDIHLSAIVLARAEETVEALRGGSHND